MFKVEVTKSVTGKIIRLVSKQWFHIVESHDYMAGNLSKIMETVNSPDCIIKGSKNELIALNIILRQILQGRSVL